MSEKHEKQKKSGSVGDEPSELGPRWKKFEVLSSPLAAFVTAVTVALLGWFGQNLVRDWEDSRVYTEILSSREGADSQLRTTMFNTILSGFLNAPANTDEPLTSRLLKLELLALNFGDSLSLSSLFVQLDKEIDRAKLIAPERDTLRRRLQSVARRVSSAQLSALAAVGVDFTAQIPIREALRGRMYRWPDAFIAEERAGLEALRSKDSTEAIEDPEVRRAQLAVRGLDKVTRRYGMEFYNADEDLSSVRVNLEVGAEDPGLKPTKISFELNYYNFPVIDNTRLSGDQRVAVVLDDFDVTNGMMHVVGVIFPGVYASLRDKPFLDDVIARLQELDNR
jgi:hypothetical protein